MTHPKSDSATSAAKRTLSLASLRAIADSGRPAGETREMLAALLEVAVLVEGGAGRREKDDVALAGELRGPGHGSLHRPEPFDRHAPGQGLLDERRRFADREDDPGRAAHGLDERR